MTRCGSSRFVAVRVGASRFGGVQRGSASRRADDFPQLPIGFTVTHISIREDKRKHVVQFIKAMGVPFACLKLVSRVIMRMLEY